MTSRRRFLSATAGLALAGMAWRGRAAPLLPELRRRVVVVGGGFGGAIAAKYLRMHDPSLEVVLIERSATYVACPFSNLVMAGLRDLGDNTVGYDELVSRHQITLLHAEVTGVDPGRRQVVTRDGTVSYERLVLAPGIDFRYDELEGADPAETPRLMPHAWKAGEQTLLLRSQLEAMRNGGTVVMSIPAAPFRCPPGPYERVCLMAWHLKRTKPRSKIIVLDANADIAAKSRLFRSAWSELYPGMVEYRPAQKVTRVLHDKRALDTGIDRVRGDVVNLIPPQQAAPIAHLAGVVGEDGHWCPVNQLSFESTRVPGIHVIGDACMAGPMPKSAFSANSQAKAAALNILALMQGRPPEAPAHVNVCYSYVNDREAMSVVGLYRVLKGETLFVPLAGGLPTRHTEIEGLQ
ncbi:MAG TPA: FAD/NAD(P)-binding oxidoreductase, partial [Burkholderiales bacterium]|nr:FAD/NAD(P)-binding oxidoreductase [Burkholderiales bacterium]